MANLARLFFDTAQAHPDRIALELEEGALSYRELAERAGRLRATLEGAGGASHVGLFASRSEGAYAGVLAILGAGAAYVPLNPGFPAARNRYIVEKADLSTLVVSPECAEPLRALLGATERPFRFVSLGRDPTILAVVDEFRGRVTWDVASDVVARGALDVDVEAPAYVLFTSGSTGNPKGVVVRHRNVLRYLENFRSLYPIHTGDRTTQAFDLTFDLSVHDLFTTWSSGATLVVFPPSALAAPVEFAKTKELSVWFSVPSLAAFLESMRQVEPGALASLRLSLFCGEKLTRNTVELWKSVAPRSRVVNLYGPTETTIAITRFEVGADFAEADTLNGAVPIGEPFPGQEVSVRREDGAPCAIGEPGALFLAGDQVTAGYLGEPELTKERFHDENGKTFYRTGDLAVRDARSRLQFVGREDFQVKVMGYRVELGEIEHALMIASGAAYAVADLAVVRNGVEELFAVLPATAEGKKKQIRTALKALLPGYMLPRHYLFVRDVPLNANGKVDRKALKERVVTELAETPA